MNVSESSGPTKWRTFLDWMSHYTFLKSLEEGENKIWNNSTPFFYRDGKPRKRQGRRKIPTSSDTAVLLESVFVIKDRHVDLRTRSIKVWGLMKTRITSPWALSQHRHRRLEGKQNSTRNLPIEWINMLSYRLPQRSSVLKQVIQVWGTSDSSKWNLKWHILMQSQLTTYREHFQIS